MMNKAWVLAGLVAVGVVSGCGEIKSKMGTSLDHPASMAGDDFESRLTFANKIGDALAHPASFQQMAGETLAGVAAQAAAAAVAAAAQPRADHKLIRTGDLDFTAEDTDAVAARIEAMAPTWDGYIAHINGRGDEGLKQYSITLRVPADRFDEARAAIKKLARRVLGEQVDTQDATDQFVDLEARLRALGATEVELLELLDESRDRERRVTDIMTIYNELTNVRAGIEQIEGRLNLLRDQTAYSTLNLKLQPDEAARPVVAQRWGPGQTARSSARSLVLVLQNLANLAIRFVILILPVTLIVGLPLYGLVRLNLRLRRREAKRPAA